MNIRDYIEQAKNQHREAYMKQSASEVLLKNLKYEIEDWRSVLTAGGFYPSNQKMTRGWPSIDEWCRDHIGVSHYLWAGGTLWFETEHDLLLFTLRWA